MILDFDVLISLISDLGQNHLELVLKNTNLFRIDPKYDLAKYKATTDEVILESAQLTDEKKLKSEFFEDKSRSILSSVFHLANVSNFFHQNLRSNLHLNVLFKHSY